MVVFKPKLDIVISATFDVYCITFIEWALINRYIKIADRYTSKIRKI